MNKGKKNAFTGFYWNIRDGSTKNGNWQQNDRNLSFVKVMVSIKKLFGKEKICFASLRCTTFFCFVEIFSFALFILFGWFGACVMFRILFV